MTWTLTLHHHGQPHAEQIPADDWDAATLVAQFFAAWTGTAVSVGAAVHAHRHRPEDQ